MTWHWTKRKPRRTGNYARRWSGNPKAWLVVYVWRDRRKLIADGTPLKDYGSGYEWSDRPCDEPLEPKKGKGKK